jgi:alpha-D-ribose 1-methylphosphonate 5-triphosphate synthase subunit PhnH
MKAKYEFDAVHGAQQVFRLLLEALANPGRFLSLRRHADRFTENGRWLAPALSLLDSETGFYWNGRDETGEEIRFLTGAAPVAPEEADFLFLPAAPSGPGGGETDILSRVKSGDVENPHDSALLLIAVQERDAGSGRAEAYTRVLFNGPGVPEAGRYVDLLPAELCWLRARDERGFQYPCGVELIFIREDLSFMAITRKVEAAWHTQR